MPSPPTCRLCGTAHWLADGHTFKQMPPDRRAISSSHRGEPLSFLPVLIKEPPGPHGHEPGTLPLPSSTGKPAVAAGHGTLLDLQNDLAARDQLILELQAKIALLESNQATVRPPTFDKKAYQREYMRKRRQNAVRP